jgi:ParB family chromosome partitioning protein
MAKIRGLGRGLDALLGGGDAALPASAETLKNLNVDALHPGKYQPRTHIDEAALAELAESIKAHGVMQPILARVLTDGGYEIVAGERRWRAARLAGLTEVPALVRDVDDSDALALALIENIQREDLNALEQAIAIQRLIREFGMTHQTAAQALGRSRSAVTNLLRLLELASPVQELVRDGKIDMGHGRALLGLPAAQQIALARRIVAEQLSVRETERAVAGLTRAAPASAERRPDRDVVRLQEELSERLGTRVVIRTGSRKGSGKLTIAYTSLAQLEAILARLDQRQGSVESRTIPR